mgnify:CR=1 FL=1
MQRLFFFPTTLLLLLEWKLSCFSIGIPCHDTMQLTDWWLLRNYSCQSTHFSSTYKKKKKQNFKMKACFTCNLNLKNKRTVILIPPFLYAQAKTFHWSTALNSCSWALHKGLSLKYFCIVVSGYGNICHMLMSTKLIWGPSDYVVSIIICAKLLWKYLSLPFGMIGLILLL